MRAQVPTRPHRPSYRDFPVGRVVRFFRRLPSRLLEDVALAWFGFMGTGAKGSRP